MCGGQKKAMASSSYGAASEEGDFEDDDTLLYDMTPELVHVTFSQPCTQGPDHFDLTFKVTFPSTAVFNDYLSEHFENVPVGDILRAKYDTIDFQSIDFDGMLAVLGVMISMYPVAVDYAIASSDEDEDGMEMD